MLDARRLEIFVTVAEEGSLTAAAARLRLTQPAVSQQIAILERDLGAALIERAARGVHLTDLGREVAERAKAILNELLALERNVRGQVDPSTQVNIGVFPTAGAYLVPSLVEEYRKRFPSR